MADLHAHSEIIKLVVAYTLLGAFVFTVFVTMLSLPGWIQFADARQQQKLFGVLVVELVVGCVGFFLGFLNLSPAKAVNQIEQPFAKATAAALERSAEILERRPIDTGSVNAAFAFRDIAGRLAQPSSTKDAERLRVHEVESQLAQLTKTLNEEAATQPRPVAEAERSLIEARLAAIRAGLHSGDAREREPLFTKRENFRIDLLEGRLKALDNALAEESRDIVEIKPVRPLDADSLRRLRPEDIQR